MGIALKHRSNYGNRDYSFSHNIGGVTAKSRNRRIFETVDHSNEVPIRVNAKTTIYVKPEHAEEMKKKYKN